MSLYRTRVVIKAVHDTDLVRLLKKLGIYEDVARGKYKCFICMRTITLENLGAIFRDNNNNIQLVCNNTKCLIKAARIVSQIK